MRLRLEQPEEQVDPYKTLAEAVLTQAIQDATHRYRERVKVKKYPRKHHSDLDINPSQAGHFLLEDHIMFDFWCQVANLSPKVVRESLSMKLSDLSTYTLIRARYQAKK